MLLANMYTIQEAGNILFGQPMDGMDRKYERRVRRFIDNGLLKVKRDGRRMYVTKLELQKFLGETHDQPV